MILIFPFLFLPLLSTMSFIHPGLRLLPHGSDLPKPFLKSIPVPSAIVLLHNMFLMIICKPCWSTSVYINLPVLLLVSLTVTVFYVRIRWLHSCMLLQLLAMYCTLEHSCNNKLAYSLVCLPACICQKLRIRTSQNFVYVCFLNPCGKESVESLCTCACVLVQTTLVVQVEQSKIVCPSFCEKVCYE